MKSFLKFFRNYVILWLFNPFLFWMGLWIFYGILDMNSSEDSWEFYSSMLLIITILYFWACSLYASARKISFQNTLTIPIETNGYVSFGCIAFGIFYWLNGLRHCDGFGCVGIMMISGVFSIFPVLYWLFQLSAYIGLFFTWWKISQKTQYMLTVLLAIIAIFIACIYVSNY